MGQSKEEVDPSDAAQITTDRIAIKVDNAGRRFSLSVSLSRLDQIGSVGRHFEILQVGAKDRRITAVFGFRVLVHGFPINAVADPKRHSHTRSPAILYASWLEPGQHVIVMGSDAEHKNEIDPSAILRADLYVPDSLKQTRRLGEIHHAIQAGLISSDAQFPELGKIVAGVKVGRKISQTSRLPT
ncbi:hypothetical protein ACVWYQ_003463 [Bradyrhizobium sp. USDA 3397]